MPTPHHRPQGTVMTAHTPPRTGSGTTNNHRGRARSAAAARAAAARRQRHRAWLLWGIAGAVAVAIVATMMWTARTTTSTATRSAPDFTSAGVTVLPIVMNTADQIRSDMNANHVTTPFLLDTDGAVSRAYGTLGKGMHAGLPGHSFVLIDATGVQRW